MTELTHADVRSLRAGAILEMDSGLAYSVHRVHGLRRTDLRDRLIWLKAINGTRLLRYTGEELIGKLWRIL